MDKELIKKNDKKTKKISISKREFIFDILFIICLVIFAIIISPKELQNDTFYTVKCGEYIFQNGIGNLTTDEFSWLDLPYCYPHWLYDLSMYIVYAKFGLDGIYISTIMLTVILGLVLYNTCLYVSKNRIASSVINFLALYVITPYIAARAQLVTFILFALEIYSIENFLETKKIRYGIYLILIAGLIAQLHVAVFPMFFIFMLPYIAEFFIAMIIDANIGENFIKLVFKTRLKFSKKENVKKDCSAKINKIEQNIKIKKSKIEKNRENPYKVKVRKNTVTWFLLLIMALSVLTGLLNPTGDTAYTYLYKTFKGNTTSSINEHLPIPLIESKEFAISLLIFIVILTFIDLKITLRDLIMLAGVTYMALSSRRQLALFVIAGAPILAKLIADFFIKYDSKTCEKLLIKATSIIGMIIIIAGFSYFGYDSYKENKNIEYINSSDYPVDAAEWIKNNLDLSTLKIYNEYNYGAYLVYQGIPVFIDSRADLYSPEFNDVEGFAQAGEDVFSDALDIPSLSRGYEEIFEKYGVNHVILYANAKMCLLLDEDNNYSLLYDDEHFKVYERLNVNIDGE